MPRWLVLGAIVLVFLWFMVENPSGAADVAGGLLGGAWTVAGGIGRFFMGIADLFAGR